MRILLLNTNCTTTSRLDDWLMREEWDVAVLLEVARRSRERLSQNPVRRGTRSSTSAIVARAIKSSGIHPRTRGESPACAAAPRPT